MERDDDFDFEDYEIPSSPEIIDESEKTANFSQSNESWRIDSDDLHLSDGIEPPTDWDDPENEAHD